jgi:hypothetical protein
MRDAKVKVEDIDRKNREYLKILSTFHYIVGGMVAAFSIFTLLYLTNALSRFSSEEFKSTGDETAAEVFRMLLATGWSIWLLGFVFAICLIASGRCLAKRKKYWFSFIVACVECMFTPFGTILGIFTIIVLLKDSVKALYGLTEP